MAVAFKHYSVDASRDGRYWTVHVPEIGHRTQARSVAEIEPMARDLIAVMTGQPVGSFSLTVTIETQESPDPS